MKGFVDDIEDAAKENAAFRHVLYTGGQMQIVIMEIKQGEEIGEEVHKDRDQFFRIEKGKGEVWIDRKVTKIKADMAIVVPAGARHNIKNTGNKSMKLYTLYAPPNHRDGVVHRTRDEAEADDEHFDGKTTE